MKVRRLPKDPGPAGWNRLLPEAGPPDPLEGAETADWLVVGAGFAGLAAARRLSLNQPGARITVLEAGRVGEGPAGRNSGFMVDLPHDLSSDNYGGELEADRAQTEDNRAGIAFAAGMADAYGLSDEAFAPVGKINAAASERGLRHNRSFAEHLAAMGEAHEFLDAAEMKRLTGIDYYKGGLFTPGAAIIQPAMFVRGVAAGLRSDGVSIREASPVTRLARNGGWVAETPGGRVEAPRAILAVNGHLESFGILPRRFAHVFTYASMTKAMTADETARLGGEARWGLTPADPMGTTVRRISGTGGDRIIVRNRATFDPTMEIDDARLARVARDHDRSFDARFPILKGLEMEYRWGGRLCLSLNNVQVVREVEDGLFAACCQNGLGTVKGTLAGMLAADLATGRASPPLDRALAAPDPRKLPPTQLSRIGAAIRLRRGEWMAGREL